MKNSPFWSSNEDRFEYAMEFAKRLIKVSRREKEKTGYRENLGYDRRISLQDYLSERNLPYRDECKILDWFDRACESI